jgi:hypothetical protein
MAKFISFGNLKGTLYNTTFRKVPLTGNVAGQKSSLDGTRVKTAPEFANTRKTNAEFKNSVSSVEALLAMILGVPAFHRNSRQFQHLIREMMKNVIPTDAVNSWGNRKTSASDITTLLGWEFNEDAPIGSIFRAPHTETVDRAAGTITIDVPAFNPVADIVANPAATHYKLTFVGAEVDLDNFTALADTASTAILPYNSTATAPISQVLTVTAGTVLPLFGVIAVSFYKLVSGNYELLDNKSYNCNSIVVADQV